MKNVPVIGKSIDANAYERLIKDLRTIWETGKTRARRAIAKEALRAYWEMGGRIAQEQLTENAGYARSVMQRLAKDIKTDMTTLYRCVQFHEIYKTVPETEVLAWAHYRLCYAQHKRIYVGLALMLASLPPLTALFSFYTT